MYPQHNPLQNADINILRRATFAACENIAPLLKHLFPVRCALHSTQAAVILAHSYCIRSTKQSVRLFVGGLNLLM